MPLFTKCRVPQDLESVTSIDRRSETDPGEVGVTAESVAAIWHAVERLYGSGIHPAIQLCVRRHGQVIIDRAIGHAAGNGPDDAPQVPKTLVKPGTPFTIFSASKAVTAMVMHLLDERHVIHLNDPVAEYVPEFAANKKQWITIHHVLAHRAGVPTLPADVMQLERLADPAAIVQMLCDAAPSMRAGRQLAYHAITGGFILGEIVRRATGRDIRTFLHDEILEPLGFRWMNYGVKPRDAARVARNYFTGPPAMPPLSTLLVRALGVPFRQVSEMSNDPRFLTSVIPSGNVVATANELSRFYQLLLDGGELDGVRIFEPRTVRRARSEQSYLEMDMTLGLPLRYGLGFMLGHRWWSPWGPDTRHAFGHVGFSNILAWADPERGIAATLMTSGKPLIYPELYYLWDITRQIGAACSKEVPPVRLTQREPPAKRRAARPVAARKPRGQAASSSR